jgi:hypothetical protein
MNKIVQEGEKNIDKGVIRRGQRILENILST